MPKLVLPQIKESKELVLDVAVLKNIVEPNITSQLLLCFKYSDPQVYNNKRNISLITTDEQETNLSMNHLPEFILNTFQESKNITQIRDSNIYNEAYDESTFSAISYRSDIFAQGHNASKINLWLLGESHTKLLITDRSQLVQKMLESSMSLVVTQDNAKANITLVGQSTLKISAKDESEIYLNAQDSILDVLVDDKATLKELKINENTTVYNISIKGRIETFEGDWFNYIGNVSDVDPLDKRWDNPALSSVYNIAKASSELKSYDV